MAWKYETKSLETVYELLNQEPVHPDYEILKETARKAYEVAIFFEEQGVNEEFVRKYLNDQLPCDALCDLHLMSSVLHPSTTDGERVYSFSHKEWLGDLAKAKQRWLWTYEGVDCVAWQEDTLSKLVSYYNELQSLALSYSLRS